MRLYVGETYRPTVSAEPAGAVLGTAYWSSSNTNVVTVNSTTGWITAVSSGTATVTVVINTGAATATGTCSVSVFSGTPPVVMGETYHIFNVNSTKPISPREGNVVDGGQVAQENYRPSSASYQKWKVIRLSNGYYVIRSAQNTDMALSGSGSSLKLSDIGPSNNYNEVPTHAQWTLSGSGEVTITTRSTGKRICIEGDVVWNAENILVGNSEGSKSVGFRFIKPSQYVPTTGVTLKEVYLLKNGSYICMPQITPSNATFKSVIWSWESRESTTDTGITMTNYDWGTSTASYTGTVVVGLKEGTYWLRAYCSDTNYNDTKDVNVHFLESGPYYFKNRESNKYMSVEGHSQADGAQIIQESFKGEVWQEFYLSRDFMTGYITIKNRHSGKYLSVLNNSGEHDTDIKQDSLPTAGNISSAETGQQFKIERISGEDTIKIIPRTGEGYTPQRVVCVANYPLNFNFDGVHVQQRDFGANDGYYRDEWYAVKLSQNDEFIINIQKLHNIAREYSPLDESRAIELTLQFIRRYRYSNDLKWELAAGTIDEAFVEHVHETDENLYQYFAAYDDEKTKKQLPFYYTAPNGDEIDIPHFAATYNVLQYDTSGTALLGLAEDLIDDLGGWAGDLRSMIPYVLYNVNYSNDYNVVYNEAKKQIGADESVSLFGIQDILADTDAFNIYFPTRVGITDSIGALLIDYYYLGGYLTRFSDFTLHRTRDEIYNSSRGMMTNVVVGTVWPIEKVIKEEGEYKNTGETLTVTDTQINAICAAFADYIWGKIESE